MPPRPLLPLLGAAALALLLAACASAPPHGGPVLVPQGPGQGAMQGAAQPQEQQGQPQRDPDLAAFKAVLSGSQLTPPAPGGGSGELIAALDRRTGLLRWKISFAGLSGPVRRAMFHRAAADGQSGPAVLPVGGRHVTSPYEGRASLTPAQQADLLAGRWQVRLSTALYPKGEIGGPLVEQH